MRHGSSNEQVRASNVGVENGIKILNGSFRCRSLESGMASVVDNDVNLAARECRNGGVDNVIAKG
jgi:hypothetical protein